MKLMGYNGVQACVVMGILSAERVQTTDITGRISRDGLERKARKPCNQGADL
jgi:hypothetical protein